MQQPVTNGGAVEAGSFLVEIEVGGTSGTDASSPGRAAGLPSGTTLSSAGRGDRATQVVAGSIEKLEEQLRLITGAVARGLAEAKPDRCTVEFGLTFKGTAGIPALASGETSGNFKVTLSWGK